MTNQQVVFALTSEDRKRIERSVSEAPQSPVYSIGLSVAYLALALWDFQLHRSGILAWNGIANLAFAGCWAFTAYWRSSSRAGFPARASLELSDAGMAGTLDGKSVTIGWAQMASVRDLGEALVVVRRAFGAKPIVIPWSSIAEPAAFWQVCEDHLIAKRGLIRASSSSGPRRTIVNTAS